MMRSALFMFVLVAAANADVCFETCGPVAVDAVCGIRAVPYGPVNIDAVAGSVFVMHGPIGVDAVYGSHSVVAGAVPVNTQLPVIIAEPQSVITTVFCYASFSVMAEGGGELRYQWQKQSSDIEQATNAAYAIASVALDDAGDYRCVVNNIAGAVTSATAVLCLEKAAPVVTSWPQAAAIIYGQKLCDSELKGGLASVAGRFAFKFPDLKPNAGVIAQPVEFLPSDTGNYTLVDGIVDVTVCKADQAINFQNIPDQFVTNIVRLSATASSGLPVCFSASAPGVISDGSNLSFAGTGIVSVTAAQPGNENWYAATSVVNDFAVFTSPPAAPAWVSASDGSYKGKVRVTWQAVNNSDSYQVWRWISDDLSLAKKLKSGVTAECFDDLAVTAGTMYHYWVRSVNSSGISEFSVSNAGYPENIFQPTNCPLFPPENVTASKGLYSGRVLVEWAAASNALAYQIWRRVCTGMADYVFVDERENTNYDDTNIVCNTTYYYKIKAKNDYEASALSEADAGFAFTPDFAGEIAIGVNNLPGALQSLRRGDRLLLAIGLMMSTVANIDADWWILAETPFGMYCYLEQDRNWHFTTMQTIVPAYQGKLFNFVEPYNVMNIDTALLPVGKYTFHFGVDALMNGLVDWDLLCRNYVVLHLTD